MELQDILLKVNLPFYMHQTSYVIYGNWYTCISFLLLLCLHLVSRIHYALYCLKSSSSIMGIIFMTPWYDCFWYVALFWKNHRMSFITRKPEFPQSTTNSWQTITIQERLCKVFPGRQMLVSWFALSKLAFLVWPMS